MNILVLGGNGYLGSKFIKKIASENQHDIVFTKRALSDLGRLEVFLDKIKSIPATLEAVEAAVEHEKFDLILNTACNYGGINISDRDVIEANLDFPLRVLNCVSQKGIKKYITIGTCLPDKLNLYSFTKKMFSDFGKYYSTTYNFDFYNLKLEMFYGHDEPLSRFIPSLIYKMLNGYEINTTKGTQHRDLIAVEDVIHAINLVRNSNLKGYHDISVGTGIAPTISELIDFIWNETGQKSKLNKGIIPIRKNEPNCVADVKIISSLGEWKPIFWKNGIKIMIEKIRKAEFRHEVIN